MQFNQFLFVEFVCHRQKSIIIWTPYAIYSCFLRRRFWCLNDVIRLCLSCSQRQELSDVSDHDAMKDKKNKSVSFFLGKCQESVCLSGKMNRIYNEVHGVCLLMCNIAKPTSAASSGIQRLVPRWTRLFATWTHTINIAVNTDKRNREE